MADLQPYIDNFFAIGSKEITDEAQRELLERLVGVEAQYFNETQKSQARENIGIIGGGVIVEKFIELLDCPPDYADRYALISDAETSQIIYSQVHGAAPKWFFVDQGCPNPSWDPEILVNGDFSDGDTGWTVPAGWSTATGAAVHTPGNTGALTQEVEGSEFSGTYKLELFTSSITAGTITITVHYALNGNQMGETYVIGISNQGAGICLFELVGAIDGYVIKITPSSTFDGTIDDCSFKKGDLGNSIPQIRGYTFNHGSVGPFEVAWRNDDLYIGRNAGWHGGLGLGGVVAVTPDGMTTITGGYNITALGHTVGNGITNEHDLILIGTGVTVNAEQSNWLKIGIGSAEILEGDLSTLDLYARGNLEVNRNLTLWAGNDYDYTFPDQITLNIGRFMYVHKSTPAGELRWSVYSLPTSLPDDSSVPLISAAGVASWLSQSNLATLSGLTAGYVPYYNGTNLVDSVIFNDAANGRIGIGTATPRGGIVDIKTAAGGYNIAMLIGPNTATVGDGGYIQFSSSTTPSLGSRIGGIRTGAGAASALVFETTNTSSSVLERMRITSSGYIGFGTDAPELLLHIKALSPSVMHEIYRTAGSSFAMQLQNVVFTNDVTDKQPLIQVGISGSNNIGGTPSLSYYYIGDGYNSNAFRIYANRNAVFYGNIGVGVSSASITAALHLKAGTETASTAPLKFTSGTLLANPEAGAVEFLSDRFYGTITTGAVRKQFAFLEDNLNLFSSGEATSGQVPTANGSGGVVWGTSTDTSKWTFIAGESGSNGNIYRKSMVVIGHDDDDLAHTIYTRLNVVGSTHFTTKNLYNGLSVVRIDNGTSGTYSDTVLSLCNTFGGGIPLSIGIVADATHYIMCGEFGFPVRFSVKKDGQILSGALTFPVEDGTANQVLTTDGGGVLSWGTIAGLPSGTNGDILYYNSGWKKLAKGTEGHYLKQGASIPEWAAGASGSKWTQGTHGIGYTSGNVGIGNSATVSEKLNVLSNSSDITTTVIIQNQKGHALRATTHAANSRGVSGSSLNSSSGVGVSGYSEYGIGVLGEGLTCGGYFKGGVIIHNGALAFDSTEVISSTMIANFVSLKIGGTERISSAGIFTPSDGVSGTLDNTKTATVVNGIITAINEADQA